MIRQRGFPAGTNVLALFSSDEGLKKHARYQEANHDDFVEIFGIEPEALTANEARYLVGFRSVDEIRDCLTKAREEIDRRLRSKGISRPGSPAASLQTGAELSLPTNLHTRQT